ncbi:MAG: SDR family oxidoreductase [Deltaproteobacteria bacterium]|nr:SDR family oxidoreductase [Deltaproteobacteria bacterium]
MERRVAFVTGASRGIGRAASIALAEKGYDVVVTARTLKEGENADGRPLPGSIETTAAEVRERGRDALALRLDLLDRKSITAALDATLAAWGRVDLLLNNGIYTGPANMQHFLELDEEAVETLFRANLFSQIFLTQRVLRTLLEQGSGSVINMVSGAGLNDPPAPAGQGGWGFAYAASKAAFHRMVGVLAVEHAKSGLRFYNLEPGFVLTEAMRLNDPGGDLSKYAHGAPPSVPAAAIAWLASDPAAEELSGQTVFAQKLCLERRLHPDWR